MDVEVKCEQANTLCHGCLSADRKVRRLNAEFSELFYKLCNDQKYDKNGDLQLCWECVAFLKKLKLFQARIKTAQCLLMQHLQSYYSQDGVPKLQSLSPLTGIQIEKINYNFSDEETIINHESNKFNDEPNHFNDKPQESYEHNKDLIDELADIKLECNDNIKEEYSSNDHYSEYCETEFKLENDNSVENSPQKQRKHNPVAEQRYYDRRKYEQFATITKCKEKFKDSIVEYSESVFLSYKEYEKVLRKDRTGFQLTKKPFKCKACSVLYVRKLDLMRHKTFCHNDETVFPYNCIACSTPITSAEHLDQHWMTSHTAMFKCTLCSDIYRSIGEVKQHLNKKHTRLFTCNACSQEFGLLREFVKHYKSTHECVICDHCGMNFTKKKSLASHMKRFHIPAHCDICKRSYSNHKTYKYHMQVTHPERIAGETRKELSYCVECDKQYPSVYKYRRHLQHSARHTPQKKIRVPCPDCGKIFTRTNFMKNHYRFAHLKVTKNYCEECDKYYTTGYGLRQHIEKVHKKIMRPKDKICDLCGRGFGTNKILMNHRRTHTGERPHKCQYCPAAFAQETAMKTHQKTQHKNISSELLS